MRIIIAFLLCLIAGKTYAVDTNAPIEEKHSSTLYNFSDNLLEAAQKCLPYQEDFTQYNPDLQKFDETVGGKFSVLINIVGLKDNLCNFDVSVHAGILGKTVYSCQITEQQALDLVKAMKNPADEEGNPLPMENTVTDDQFEAEWNKIVGQSCLLIQEDFSGIFLQDALKNSNKLSTDFLESLRKCSSYSDEKDNLLSTQNVKIIGWQDSQCVLHYKDFDLAISKENILNIKTWEDLDNLITDEKIRKYYPENSYLYEDIALIIRDYANDQCSCSTQMTDKKNNIEITRGYECKTNSDGCMIRFINRTKIGNVENDYSKKCIVTKRTAKILAERYSDLLDYVSDRQIEYKGFAPAYERAKQTDQMSVANYEIWQYLNQKGLCSF